MISFNVLLISRCRRKFQTTNEHLNTYKNRKFKTGNLKKFIASGYNLIYEDYFLLKLFT